MILDYVKIAVLIIQLLRNDYMFEWTEVYHRTFKELKYKLSTYPVLRPPDWTKHFHVFFDASNVAVDSVLCQSTRKKSKTNPLFILVSN